jgi:hypothetical protein
MSTKNAVQEHYARNEGLTTMHMDHSAPIGGAIVGFCLDQWFTSGTQNQSSPRKKPGIVFSTLAAGTCFDVFRQWQHRNNYAHV